MYACSLPPRSKYMYLRVSSIPLKVVQKAPYSVAYHIAAICINCLNNLIYVTLKYDDTLY
jgi:hypothetical protein